MTWWERYPGELEREILELESAGMQPRKNVAWFSVGKAAVDIRLEVLGQVKEALITYPDLYPYFRPTLQVPGLGVGLRHYNPCAGDICLLQRGTQHWLPNMTAARLIREMLPHWEQAATRKYDESRLEAEDNQAEPVTVYYPAKATQVVAMDSSWCLPPLIKSGRIKLALPNGHKSIVPSECYAAWVTGIEDDKKKSILGITLSESIQRWLKAQEYTECIYPWIRLDAPPRGRTPLEIASIIATSYPKVQNHINQEIAALRNGLYGLCFPEEDPNGGQREGWLFLAYHCDRKLKSKKGVPPTPDFWLLRPDYAGERDLFERVSELHPLRSKKVAVIGLGCVGAPSALALARAGVGELRLLDGDVVSAGTTCRWPLGLSAVGMGKVQELTRFISNNYPLTQIGIDHYPHGNKKNDMISIGEQTFDYDQWDCIDKLLNGVDLIYDATAEQGINLMLNDLAIARNIPYVTVSSRPGGWGGNVVRVDPRNGRGCYRCYLQGLQDKQIPQPAYDANGDGLQPVGCGDITFKAAGFDVEEIALAGVRMAVSTLCASSTGYPPILYDVGILSLRKDDVATFPEWQSEHLHKHPECVCKR